MDDSEGHSTDEDGAWRTPEDLRDDEQLWTEEGDPPLPPLELHPPTEHSRLFNLFSVGGHVLEPED